MRAILGGLRVQFWWIRGDLDQLQGFMLIPLFTSVFGGMVAGAGRPQLLPVAALGAALSCLWLICVGLGGSIIENERWNGTFEPLLTARAPIYNVVLGRATAITLVTALMFPEAWLVTWLIFGEAIPVPHPGLLVGTIGLTMLGVLAAAILIAGLFVLARTAIILQNAVTYPVFLLGGLLVPTSVLPEWVQPATRIIFLSWSSDLLRAALRPGPVDGAGPRLVGLAAAVAVTWIVGTVTLRAIVNRARRHGTLSL